MNNMKKYKKIAHKIHSLSPEYREMNDETLKNQTFLFRNEIKKGRKLMDLLPQVFATVIEASKRVLGMEPYHVQILGGLALFFGNIAEIKTGEGKTLVATMPLYARALEGNKGNFLITSNEYLAERDGEEMGKLFKWLNISVGVDGTSDNQDIEDKRIIYNSDIIYTTHSKLGFDYLFDNLGSSLTDKVLSKFNFAIIDEIDSVLLDGAQTSLVISGPPKVPSNYYHICDWFVKSLSIGDYEYSTDRRKVWMTSDGLLKLKNYFNIEGIYDEMYSDFYRHIILAIQANFLKKKGKDYVVVNGEILLLDIVNGRTMAGVKLQGGIHQAIEAKENVEVTNETKTLGMISYQSLFKKFKRLSGMTGTAKTDEKEFMETYHLSVIEIPTNIPTKRIDKKDRIYVTNQSKIEESIKEVKQGIIDKRPVLIETGSVSMSNLYSLILLKNKIPHNLLNARTAAREKQIIKDAGRSVSVTLATSMAGRGTDIKLTEESKLHGGLKIVGTERMSSKRIDNQLRGRAGRQGEPGETVFFVSLEDKMIIENSPRRIRKSRISLLDQISKGKRKKTELINNQRLTKVMDKAQKQMSNNEYQSRKTTLAYDTIMNSQRELIYSARNQVMSEDEEYLESIISQCISKVITNFISHTEDLSKEDIADFVFNNIKSDYPLKAIKYKNEHNKTIDNKNVYDYLYKLSLDLFKQSLNQFQDNRQLTYFKKIIILRAIDLSWIQQLDYLQQLKIMISGRDLAQHKPVNEYGREAREHFYKMEDQIFLTVFRGILLSKLVSKPDGTIDIEFP